MARSTIHRLAGGAVVAMSLFAGCATSYGTSDRPTISTDAASDALANAADSAQDDGATKEDADAGAMNAPTVIASGLTDLAGVAATETTVYFTERGLGLVRSVPITGGAVADIQNTGGSPSSIVVTSTDVFWGDFGANKLSRRGLAGGVITTVTKTPGMAPIALTAASDRIVVVALGATNVGEIQQYLFDFSAAASVGGVQNPAGAAVYLGDIFWTESSLGQIWQGQSGTGLATVIAPNESSCESIAVDGSGLYWTRPTPSGLVRWRLPGGGPITSLAASQALPMSLAADTSGVYWMNAGDGTLRRSARSELPAEIFAKGFNSAFNDLHIQAIALTSKYVVWITNDGQVLRLAK